MLNYARLRQGRQKRLGSGNLLEKIINGCMLEIRVEKGLRIRGF